MIVSAFEEVAVEVAWGSGLVAPDMPAADGASGPVCTENLIHVDEVTESPKLVE